MHKELAHIWDIQDCVYMLCLLHAHRLAADDEAFKQQRIANTQHYKQTLAEQVEIELVHLKEIFCILKNSHVTQTSLL